MDGWMYMQSVFCMHYINFNLNRQIVLNTKGWMDNLKTYQETGRSIYPQLQSDKKKKKKPSLID